MNYTSNNITVLKENEVFVFGSNLSGRHGKGAALQAVKFGARNGIGEGLRGQSYGLPTKDECMDELPLYRIGNIHVEALRRCVRDNPDKHFLITKVGCGLARFTVDQIAPLFKDFLELQNVSLPEEFVLELTPTTHEKACSKRLR